MKNNTRSRLMHGTAVLILLLSYGCVSSRSQKSLEERIQQAEKGLPASAGILPWKKRTIYEQMDRYQIPGVSVAVIEDDKVIYAQGYGTKKAGGDSRITDKTMFRAMGVSSQVSRFLALNFVEKGVLPLHENINHYLKSWKIPKNQWTEKQAVTLEHLLKFNTAGFNCFYMAGYPRGGEIPSLYQVLEGLPPAKTPAVRVVREPGQFKRGQNYWVVSYIVLEQLLQDTAGQPFPQIARDVLFSPLGLENSTFKQPLPEKYRQQACTGHNKNGPIDGYSEVYPTQAAMSLWTTSAELAEILIEMMHAFSGESSRIISAETASEVINLGRPYQYWYSNGSGYYCAYIFNPALGQGVAVMINHEAGDELRKEISHSIFRSFGWQWGGDLLLIDRLIYKWMAFSAVCVFILILLLGTALVFRLNNRA